MRGFRMLVMVLAASLLTMIFNTMGFNTRLTVSDGTFYGLLEIQIYLFLIGLVLGAGIMGFVGATQQSHGSLIGWMIVILLLPWIGRYLDSFIPPVYDLIIMLMTQSASFGALAGGLICSCLFNK